MFTTEAGIKRKISYVGNNYCFYISARISLPNTSPRNCFPQDLPLVLRVLDLHNIPEWDFKKLKQYVQIELTWSLAEEKIPSSNKNNKGLSINNLENPITEENSQFKQEDTDVNNSTASGIRSSNIPREEDSDNVGTNEITDFINIRKMSADVTAAEDMNIDMKEIRISEKKADEITPEEITRLLKDKVSSEDTESTIVSETDSTFPDAETSAYFSFNDMENENEYLYVTNESFTHTSSDKYTDLSSSDASMISIDCNEASAYFSCNENEKQEYKGEDSQRKNSLNLKSKTNVSEKALNVKSSDIQYSNQNENKLISRMCEEQMVRDTTTTVTSSDPSEAHSFEKNGNKNKLILSEGCEVKDELRNKLNSECSEIQDSEKKRSPRKLPLCAEKEIKSNIANKSSKQASTTQDPQQNDSQRQMPLCNKNATKDDIMNVPYGISSESQNLKEEQISIKSTLYDINNVEAASSLESNAQSKEKYSKMIKSPLKPTAYKSFLKTEKSRDTSEREACNAEAILNDQNETSVQKDQRQLTNTCTNTTILEQKTSGNNIPVSIQTKTLSSRPIITYVTSNACNAEEEQEIFVKDIRKLGKLTLNKKNVFNADNNFSFKKQPESKVLETTSSTNECTIENDLNKLSNDPKPKSNSSIHMQLSISEDKIKNSNLKQSRDIIHTDFRCTEFNVSTIDILSRCNFTMTNKPVQSNLTVPVKETEENWIPSRDNEKKTKNYILKDKTTLSDNAQNTNENSHNISITNPETYNKDNKAMKIDLKQKEKVASKVSLDKEQNYRHKNIENKENICIPTNHIFVFGQDNSQNIHKTGRRKLAMLNADKNSNIKKQPESLVLDTNSLMKECTTKTELIKVSKDQKQISDSSTCMQLPNNENKVENSDHKQSEPIIHTDLSCTEFNVSTINILSRCNFAMTYKPDKSNLTLHAKETQENLKPSINNEKKTKNDILKDKTTTMSDIAQITNEKSNYSSITKPDTYTNGNKATESDLKQNENAESKVSLDEEQNHTHTNIENKENICIPTNHIFVFGQDNIQRTHKTGSRKLDMLNAEKKSNIKKLPESQVLETNSSMKECTTDNKLFKVSKDPKQKSDSNTYMQQPNNENTIEHSDYNQSGNIIHTDFSCTEFNVSTINILSRCNFAMTNKPVKSNFTSQVKETQENMISSSNNEEKTNNDILKDTTVTKSDIAQLTNEMSTDGSITKPGTYNKGNMATKIDLNKNESAESKVSLDEIQNHRHENTENKVNICIPKNFVFGQDNSQRINKTGSRKLKVTTKDSPSTDNEKKIKNDTLKDKTMTKSDIDQITNENSNDIFKFNQDNRKQIHKTESRKLKNTTNDTSAGIKHLLTRCQNTNKNNTITDIQLKIHQTVKTFLNKENPSRKKISENKITTSTTKATVKTMKPVEKTKPQTKREDLTDSSNINTHQRTHSDLQNLSISDAVKQGNVTEEPMLLNWKEYFRFYGRKVMCHDGKMIFQLCRIDKNYRLDFVAYIVRDCTTEFPAKRKAILIPEPGHVMHDPNVWGYYWKIYNSITNFQAQKLTPHGIPFDILKSDLAQWEQSVIVAQPISG